MFNCENDMICPDLISKKVSKLNTEVIKKNLKIDLSREIEVVV